MHLSDSSAIRARGPAARRFSLAILVLSAIALAAAPAAAARRALVIGNADYARAPDLPNPANDARDVAARLADIGFDVAGGGAQLDLTREGLVDAVRDFAGGLEEGDLALFYFAGHGAQAQGENFLIPTDDDAIRFTDDLPESAYSANLLIKRLESRPGVTNVIILDACRNNPLGVRQRSLAGAGAGAGLAHMDAPTTSFSFIIFAAEKGRTASDGAGRNSRFTAALLHALERPRRRLDDMAYEIRASVRQASDGEQIPWINSSLEAPIFLMPQSSDRPPDVRPTQPAPATQVASSTRSEPSIPPEIESVSNTSSRSAAPTEEPAGESAPEPETEPEEGLLPDADPSYPVVTLASGFDPDPQRLRVLAGGTEDAAQADPVCRGFIARRPDYVLDYAAGTFRLYLAATSPVDTVLVVRGPSGAWSCSDDFDGVNPAVSFTQPESGLYRIWVGVYAADAGYPGADLTISEIKPQF